MEVVGINEEYIKNLPDKYLDMAREIIREGKRINEKRKPLIARGFELDNIYNAMFKEINKYLEKINFLIFRYENDQTLMLIKLRFKTLEDSIKEAQIGYTRDVLQKKGRGITFDKLSNNAHYYIVLQDKLMRIYTEITILYHDFLDKNNIEDYNI